MLVPSQEWKLFKLFNVWNLFKVNNTENRKTWRHSGVYNVNLNRFGIFFWGFHFWLWTSKCRVSHNYLQHALQRFYLNVINFLIGEWNQLKFDYYSCCLISWWSKGYEMLWNLMLSIIRCKLGIILNSNLKQIFNQDRQEKAYLMAEARRVHQLTRPHHSCRHVLFQPRTSCLLHSL